jgi:hypothetical protein
MPSNVAFCAAAIRFRAAALMVRRFGGVWAPIVRDSNLMTMAAQLSADIRNLLLKFLAFDGVPRSVQLPARRDPSSSFFSGANRIARYCFEDTTLSWTWNTP